MSVSEEKINVTKTFLPPLVEYEAYLKQIWANEQLTNQGPLVIELEQKLKDYLGVQNFHFVSNGTMALQVALRALDINEGEVITTPFSYVATTSSILWERCTPVFVDIDPETLCIDATKIEPAITDKTKAIMPVHVFGQPCDVEATDTIAKKHNLKVIYDAAHAFGVQYKGKSLIDYGDISICSFHATKLFHTIEGGALIIKDKAISDKVAVIKRFGHNYDEHLMLGINAKASEFQAAMGLCNLKHLSYIIEARKQVVEQYNQLLGKRFGVRQPPEGTTYNYAYYPIIFDNEMQLLAAMKKLNQFNIFPRRYFYPSLNKLPYLEDSQSCPISEGITLRILCLPLYVGLEPGAINKICEILTK